MTSGRAFFADYMLELGSLQYYKLIKEVVALGKGPLGLSGLYHALEI